MKGRACEDPQDGHNNFQHGEYQVHHCNQRATENLTRPWVSQYVRTVPFLCVGAPASGQYSLGNRSHGKEDWDAHTRFRTDLECGSQDERTAYQSLHLAR